MRYIVLFVLLGTVSFGVSLVVLGLATPVAPEAAAQLGETPSLVQHGWTAVREFVQDLVDGFTAPLRGRTERIGSPGILP
jgi:hypothetical protein